MRARRIAAAVLAVAAVAALWATCAGPEPAPRPIEPAPTTSAKPSVENAPPPGVSLPGGRDVVLSGRVRCRQDGRPVEDAALTLVAESSTAGRAVSGADGRFALSGWTPATEATELSLRVEKGGYVPLTRSDVAAVASETDLGDVWLDRAVGVRVVVRSLAGEQLADARVEALPATTGLGPIYKRVAPWSEQLDRTHRPAPTAARTTGADGRAVFPDLPPGGTVFVASHETHASGASKTLMLIPGERPSDVEIVLSPAHRLHGRVVTADDHPAAGVLVTAGERHEGWVRRARTDEQGTFEIGGVPAGVAYLYLTPRPGLTARGHTVRVPIDAEVVLRLPPTGRLTGRVVRETSGEPVGGVRLTFHVLTGSLTTTSNADGAFALEDVPKGISNLLSARSDGLVLSPQQPDYVLVGGNMGPALQIGEVAPYAHVTRTVVVREAASLSGVVNGPDGPLAGARVFAKTKGRGFLEWGTTCDDAGRYTFPAMVAGRIVLYVEADGHVPVGYPTTTWERVVRTGAPTSQWLVEVPDTGAVTRDLTLTRGVSVSGLVADDSGRPIAGARVVASRAVADAPRPETWTDSDGNYALSGVEPVDGTRIHAQAEGYEPGRSAPLQFVDATPPASVAFILAPNAPLRVTGRVTSREGIPTSGGFVQLNAYGGDYAAVRLAEWERAERFPIAADGTYEATLTAGGFASLRVRAIVPGHADARSGLVALDPGGSRELTVDLEATRGTAIEGGVHDRETGAPVAGAALRLNTVLSGEHMVFFRSIEGVTDANGRFRIENVPDGEVAITVLAPGYAEEYALLDVPETVSAEIALPRAGRLAGIVRWANGTPLAGAVVGIHPGEKAVNGRMPKTSIRTAPNGGFRFEGLYPGKYFLSVSAYREDDQDFAPRRTGPHAPPQGDIELVVEPAGSVSGVVVDDAGEPLEDVTVEVLIGPDRRRGATAVDGSFRIGGLTPGTYDVIANPRGEGGGRDHAEARTERVDVPAHRLRLTLPVGQSIHGVVRDASGTGVARLWLGVGARRVATDGFGRFTFGGLGEGTHDIIVTGPPLGPRRHTFTRVEGGKRVAAGSADLVLTAR